MNKRIPGATYRLQFNRDFTFAQAREVVSYLRDLGITDCYASPLFKAAPQSTHGYDVCDFNQLNPNLGTSQDFEGFVARLRELGIGLLLDMVPNHMSTDLSNRWWFDVLENGPGSKYANWFDIDWQRFEEGKVVLPVLEDELEAVLVAGKLRLVSEIGKFFIAYYDRRFPLSPTSLATTLKESPGRHADAILNEYNGTAGQAMSFARLRDLLDEQYYCLAFWRTGSQQINYRRFFDISELISLRMELPEVFEGTHHLLSRLFQEQKITALRIDHPDGLWNPKQYLERLQGKFGSVYVVVEKILTDDEALPEDWPVDGTTGYDFLNPLNGIFVNQQNKAAFDRLYSDFTGSDCDFREMVYIAKKRVLERSFPSELNALSCRLEEIGSLIQPGSSYDQGELRKILVEVLACFPVYRTYVTEETAELSAVEKEQIEQAIHDVRAKLSTHAPRSVAALVAPHSSEEAGPEPLSLIYDLLHLRAPDHLDDSAKRQCREFVMRFQQLSGPLMAKGLEDTTFYNFNRLISLNEVGGDPGSFGNSVDDFHQHNLQKAARWPHSLLATATHDTKRGEDVRARINVLSEIPDEWRTALQLWQKLNADKKTIVNGQAAPHANDEYFFYQTLIGAWLTEISTGEQSKVFRERVIGCMLKSLKEAKAHTSWTEPSAAYEDATKRFIDQTLQESSAKAFLADFKAFQGRVAFFGHLNSLSQTVLKMTAPGVPDFYQGTELWDLNLVDPDNRRPVDYKMRQQILADLKGSVGEGPGALPRFLAQSLDNDPLGRSKLYVIWRILEFRNRHREIFELGDYIPLAAVGCKKENICAFARVWQQKAVVVVVPRLIANLLNSEVRMPFGQEIWADTNILLPATVAKRQRTNILTNEVMDLSNGSSDKGLAVSQLLARFPVAVLG